MRLPLARSPLAAPALALVLGAALSAQLGVSPAPGTPSPVETSRLVTITGCVLADGMPALGARVTSSTGAESVVGPDGRFRLETLVPLEAERVELEAADGRGRSRAARTSVSVQAPGGLIDAGVLVLGTEDCLRRWIPTLGGRPGANGAVLAMTMFDDGTGPALYVGGGFSVVDGVAANKIAKRVPSGWEALGDGIENGTTTEVRALAAFDDGSGPALYVGGRFSTAGGLSVRNIARWDGAAWSEVGSGLGGFGIGFFGDVYALAVYDDGSGPALYAGGSFESSSGGQELEHVAKWDGTSWTPLAQGTNGFVYALHVFDFGSGPVLCVGGSFSGASGVGLPGKGTWDGTSWSRLGVSPPMLVRTFTTFDDGSGTALYVGGNFASAGPPGSSYIARFDGTTWSSVGTGTNDIVRTLAVFDDGGGPALIAGGEFTTAGDRPARHLSRWNGSSWSTSVTGPDDDVLSLAVVESGGQSALLVGGSFQNAGAVEIRRIAKSDGTNLAPLSQGGLRGDVLGLETFDDGNGPALYMAGAWTHIGDVQVNRVARWDGTRWNALGSGLNDVAGPMAVFDDGRGPALYVGGAFSQAGGRPASGVARWDGTDWSRLAGGTNGAQAMVVHDDGSGPALYVGGPTVAGGMPVQRVARWNGLGWSGVGSELSTTVWDIEVYDDGNGAKLYAGGGVFTALGTCVARWDGVSWSAFGGGVTSSAQELAVFDDGNGPALFVAGNLTLPDGEQAGVARWDGTSWTAIGRGSGLSLAVFDDGRGPALVAGGSITSLDGLVLNHMGRWDGQTWEALGRGTNQSPLTLLAFDDGRGPTLWVGGRFESALDSHDSYLARWGCFPDTIAPTLECPELVFAPETDRGNRSPGEFVSFSVSAHDDLDPEPDVVCTPPSGSFFPRGITRVLCTATDASGNQTRCEFPVIVEVRAGQR